MAMHIVCVQMHGDKDVYKRQVISGVTMVFVPAVSTFYISKKLGGISDVMIGDIIEQQFKQAYNPYMGCLLYTSRCV